MVTIINPFTKEKLFESPEGLVTSDNKIIFPLRNGVNLIAAEDNYTSNFGFEWNLFDRTQIDKFSGIEISMKRFFAETRWSEDLQNENILEVGCGAGRFSQVVLKNTKANLYAVDYSNATEANYRNNGPHERLKVFQASIYDLPFAKENFEKVFCFGVLQHTSDFKKSVQCLVEMVKPGGEIVIDFYPVKGWYSKINAKYLLRPFLKNMDHQKLLNLIRKNVSWMMKLYKFNNRIGLSVINRFIPVCDINNTIPEQLDGKELNEWVILDTFDMFSPAYDNPQRLSTVARWLKEFGIIEIDAQVINYFEHMTAATIKGKKPL